MKLYTEEQKIVPKLKKVDMIDTQTFGGAEIHITKTPNNGVLMVVGASRSDMGAAYFDMHDLKELHDALGDLIRVLEQQGER